MICEREDEIATFVAREYWTIDAELRTFASKNFRRKLIEFRGGRSNSSASPTKPRPTMSSARSNDATPRASSRSLSVERKQRKRNPAPPFTTSTLQQEAARKLGFSAQKHHARRAAAL